MLTARWAASWSAANARRLSPSQQRGVAGRDDHGAVDRAGRLDRHADRVPGALLGLLDREHHVGDQRLDVRADLLALVTDHGDDLRGSTACTAARTWPIMLRPPIGWSTFMVFDFMRVPPPAARTITVRFCGTSAPRR